MFACEGFHSNKVPDETNGANFIGQYFQFQNWVPSLCVFISTATHTSWCHLLYSDQSRLWQHYWFGCWSVPRELEEFLMKTLLSLMQVIGPKEVACGWSICYPGPPTDFQTDHGARESKSRCLVLSCRCSEKNVWWLKGGCWIGLSKE